MCSRAERAKLRTECAQFDLGLYDNEQSAPPAPATTVPSREQRRTRTSESSSEPQSHRRCSQFSSATTSAFSSSHASSRSRHCRSACLPARSTLACFGTTSTSPDLPLGVCLSALWALVPAISCALLGYALGA